ncbi:MAG TPA: hypothetical protein VFS35_08265 [Terrimicrobiaceae bacterium]|nr:hypothetical protein [Terrimicrobiaceae bacterium]
MSVSTVQVAAYLRGVEIHPDMVLPAPKTPADYERLSAVLDSLIDEVGEDESHPWAEFMDRVGTLIEEYEDAHIPELEAS